MSCKNAGIFPDLAIRLNKDKSMFTGGELIELKDSSSYSVSSFNSTIPSRSKKIENIIPGENSIIKKQMEEAGDDIFSSPVREVYYLVRGKKNQNTKICLVNGSFFETVSIENLISQSFSQVLDERLRESGQEIPKEFQQTLTSIFSQQQNFSKVRNIEKASVKLRFRIMIEVKAEGNILNPKKYPEIKDNTLNFILPCHSADDEKNNFTRLKIAFNPEELSTFSIFKIKHHFNGHFLVVQRPF
ncbi:hypothetical protein L0Z72_14050 [candidate division KSB1 bacterium]|nr:hypothetical protein [candidate division KSB1 bacterium]